MTRHAVMKIVLGGLKLLVLGGSLYLLTRLIDGMEFRRALTAISPGAFLLVVALNLATAFIMTQRWNLVLRAAGIPIPYRTALAYSMLGMFFNQILPGSLSGDAARVLCLRGRPGGWVRAAASVFWERVLGLAGLLVVLLATLPFYGIPMTGPGTRVILFLVTVTSLALFLGLQHPGFFALAERLLAGGARLVSGEHGAGRVRRHMEGITPFLTDRRLTFVAVIISLGIRLLWLAGAWVLARALGLSVPFGYCLFFISLVEFLRLVPLSIQGLGVRELAFVFFLAPYGVGAAEATLLSLLFYTALTVAGLLAGLGYLTRRWWEGVPDGA